MIKYSIFVAAVSKKMINSLFLHSNKSISKIEENRYMITTSVVIIMPSSNTTSNSDCFRVELKQISTIDKLHIKKLRRFK